ncbi:MAG: hypothetical protein AAFU71_07345, partial [Cyanobacteria bacterium J06632_22]
MSDPASLDAQSPLSSDLNPLALDPLSPQISDPTSNPSSTAIGETLPQVLPTLAPANFSVLGSFATPSLLADAGQPALSVVGLDTLTRQDGILIGLDDDTLTFTGNQQANELWLQADANRLLFSTDGVLFKQLGGVDLSLGLDLVVNLGAGDDQLSVDQSLVTSLLPGQLQFDGAGGNDILNGPGGTPGSTVVWSITGRNSGSLTGGITFNQVENLVGAANNQDTFILEAGGRLDGRLDGNVGGFDILNIEKTSDNLTYQAFGPDSGLITLDGQQIEFAGLEPINAGNASQVEIVATDNDDELVLEEASSTTLQVRSLNGTMESLAFSKTATSARILLGDGDDSLTIQNLGSGVTTDITVAGSSLETSIPVVGDFLDDLLQGSDSVTFAGDALLQGGSLTVDAETISVNADVVVSTRELITPGTDPTSGVSAGDSGRISFSGETIDIAAGAKLLAQVEAGSAFAAGIVDLKVEDFSIVRRNDTPSPGASLSVSNAEVRGGEITLSAKASERFGVFGFKKDAAASVLVDTATLVGTSVTIDANADTSLVPPLEIEMSNPGATTLEFRNNGTGPATIKRLQGNWLEDGFLSPLVSPTITVVDSQNNNDDIYRVASISGDTITLADGEAFDSDETTANVVKVIGTSILPDTEELTNTFLTALLPFQGSAFVSLANTAAIAQVKGASTIEATQGSVKINANADGRATPLGPALSLKKVFNIAGAFAQSTAKALATVEGSSTITAANQVQVLANTLNTSKATSITPPARNTPINLTFAGAITNSETKAFTGAGTNITGKGVQVSADTELDIAVASSVANAGGSGAGIAVGLNLIDTVTEAHIDGTVRTTDSAGKVAVSANALTTDNITATDSANLGNTQNLGFTQQLSQQFNSFFKNSGQQALKSAGVTGISGKLGNLVLSKLFPTLKSGKFNLGGAITIADAEQGVKAYIAPDAQVTADGSVEVLAKLTDRMNVSANASTTSDKAAVGGAVVVGNTANDVQAYIGERATVTAVNDVRVDARIEIPFPWENALNTLAELLAFDFDSPEEVVAFLGNAFFEEGAPGLDTLFTSFVQNSSGGSKFGLSGAVEVMNFSNSARAEIADSAQVTAANVEVFARTEMNTMNLVGGVAKFSYSFLDRFLLNKFAAPINSAAQKVGIDDKYRLNQPAQPKAGIGGSFTFYDVDNSAVATIGDGAAVTATQGDVVVASDIEERAITVTSSQGTSDKLGVFGAASLVNLNTTSVAFIEDTAKITAQEDVAIRATSDPRAYNLTLGGINIFRPQTVITGDAGDIGIGAAVGLSTVETVTKAFIGNEKSLSGAPTLTFNDTALTGNPALNFQNVALQGDPGLTFIPVAFDGDLTLTQNDTAPDTITRTGDWSTDNFVAGQVITLSGTEDGDGDGVGDNDGSYEIASVNGNTLTLADTAELASSSSSIGVSVVGADSIRRNAGSWSDDGFEVGQVITVSGAGDNDGNYEIAEIAGDVLTLVEGNVFTSQADISGVAIESSDRITRSTGSWIDDGFIPGQTLTISGSGSNDGTFTIDEVSDTTIILRRNLLDEDDLTTAVDESSLDTTLVTEQNATGVTITAADTIRRSTGSWRADGFNPGDTLIVSGTSNNNGAFKIAAIDGDTAILESSTLLQDEVVTDGVAINGDTLQGSGSITAKDVSVDALSGEQIISFTIASTKTSGNKDTGKADASASSAPSNGDATDTSGGKFGFGASGDVSINTVQNNTRAYIDGDMVVTTTGEVDLFAASTGTPRTTGEPELVFTDVGANDTITRSTGSWLGDGFEVGQTLRVKDAGNNDGYYRIQSVTDTVITLVAGDTLTSLTTTTATVSAGPAMAGAPGLTFKREILNRGRGLTNADTITRASGSWIAEGFRPGQTIQVSGTGSNDGEYRVADVTATQLSIAVVTLSDLSLDRVLQDETIASGSSVTILAEDDGLSSNILAGSGSVVLQGRDRSAGLAGSYSQNTVSGGVQAFIKQAALSADGDISLAARSPGSIESYAASGNKGGKLGIAGQVTNNEVNRHTHAFLTDATVQKAEDVRVD